ncbi:hypothetical protein NPIL_427191 [Nephila pilipes]|uniref:B box-type domain-containing protein n=1 Tax=Nephila pilipes TaxID=299642 RepID=A0A8X6PEP8_NEPPI|nr:hypothetical protein NPIL_427191 [Nephila pilipes]
MLRKKVFKTAEEAIEYLFSEELESEMFVLPPEVDKFTDEEGFDDSETLDPSVRDVICPIIDMDVANTCVIYNMVNAEKKSIKEIRRHIAIAYLKKGNPVQIQIGIPSYTISSRMKETDTVRRDGVGYIISKREKQRRCQMQNSSGKPLIFCMKCNVTLCTKCFPNYHT